MTHQTDYPPLPKPRNSFFETPRGRVVRENLTAYLFISPAIGLIFLFGIFPVGFAFFVSLHRWRRFPGEYLGLTQYVRALDDFAYIIFFWIAIGLFGYALSLLIRLIREEGIDKAKAISYFVPGVAVAAATVAFLNWIVVLLPIVLNIPQVIRGQERVQGIFISEMLASLRLEETSTLGNQFLGLFLLAIVLSAAWMRIVRGTKLGTYWFWASAALIATAFGVLTLNLTLQEIDKAILAAREAGTELPIWSQIILISAGAGMMIAAFMVWQRAVTAQGDKRFGVMAFAAILLAAGGVILAMELPRALAQSDPDMLRGFGITVMFVFGTVPFQLAIGLGLATLMFQNIKGKSLFRMVYFLPYIMPFVATSIVFNQIFSHRTTSPINHAMTFLALPTQKWLLEPLGIGTLVFGNEIPAILAGPSLALIVIMIYTIWTYIGYNTVVFLAGLGNISPELYEAARIDGASSWSIFRHITLPLLSPTTFFLSLIAIIGTFQAFTQIWIMRTPASSRSVDTIGVHIFETVRSTDPNMGYGSAMAFVLFGVILILTLFQNRIMGRKVFYG